MKNISYRVVLILLVTWAIGSIVSCTANCESYNSIENAQKRFNSFSRSKVIDPEGHELILYENSSTEGRNYSFSIEHSPNCKKCYELFN